VRDTELEMFNKQAMQYKFIKLQSALISTIFDFSKLIIKILQQHRVKT